MRPLAAVGGGDGGAALVAYKGFDLLNREGSVQAHLPCAPLGMAQVFQGYRGALYPPRLLLGAERAFSRYVAATSADVDCRVSDDLVMSNFLEARGVTRFLADGRGVADAKLPQDSDGDASFRQSGGHSARYRRVLQWLRARGLLFLDGGREPCSRR